MQVQNVPLDTILGNLKFKALNAMQQASLEANRQEGDIVLLSATGSGKTLAFLLPLLDRLDKENKNTQALVIVPSRELAQQIELVWKQMGTGFKITCCYGGHKREIEENNLVQPPALIVGTPGRLADHIRRENITVNTISYLVLDEFDKTLELGFKEEVSNIVEALPNVEKRMLTSATEAVEIPAFLGMKEMQKLNFLGTVEVPEYKLTIKQVISTENDKVDTLFKLICHTGGQSSIVFCNHRDSVKRTSELLAEKGIPNVYYHGAMEQVDRDAALAKFRNGSSNVLITTDLAARGLDIPNIRYIIHYHLPHTEDSFTHRNGRTARMDASGTVVMILNPEERLPDYVEGHVEEIELPAQVQLPAKPKWTTFYISAGKKDKVNKIDIVGFLGNKAQLKKEDIGLIDVKDFFSFVAIRKSKANTVLPMLEGERIKNKKVKIEIAK